MEEEELRPMRGVEQSIAGMGSRPLQSNFVHPFQFVQQDGAPGIDGIQQMPECPMLIAGEVGVGVRHISVESGRCLHLYPFETDEENALVAGQVGDMIKGAPLAGIGVSPELLFGKIAHEFADGLVLMSEAGEC